MVAKVISRGRMNAGLGGIQGGGPTVVVLNESPIPNPGLLDAAGTIAVYNDGGTWKFAQFQGPGATDWNEFVTATSMSQQEIFVAGADYNSNFGEYRTRNVGGAGSQKFSFKTPENFGSVVSLFGILSPSAGAAGVGKDIDLFSEYGKLTEDVDAFTEQDIVSTYDFTGLDGKWSSFDISSVFNSLAAGHICGVTIDNKSIGGSVEIVGINMLYLLS